MTKFNLGLFLSNLVLLGFYAPLNQPRFPMYILESNFDKLIPFIPAFVVPYLSFYIFLPFTVFSLRNERYIKSLYITLSASFIAIVISYLIYLFFQTQIVRPIISSDDFFLTLLSYLYFIDNPYNGFPSIHTSLSTIGILTWVNRKSKYSKIFILWAVTIIISTMLVKQHYIADIFGGIILAALSYILCSKLNFFNKNL